MQENSDLPDLKDIRIMGYSMRDQDYRFTLWVGFDPNTFQVVETNSFDALVFVLDAPNVYVPVLHF